ncbi:hypothetical protein [Acinetobacter sp. c1-l78]|uniref:hypothetical protein n=1 Tax=Acinetobacter sp. c1-l78 TaxID=3342803 RepID=UPI0035B9CD9A
MKNTYFFARLLLLSMALITHNMAWANTINLNNKNKLGSDYTSLNHCEKIPTSAAELYTEKCQSLDTNYQVRKPSYENQIWLNISYQPDEQIASKQAFFENRIGYQSTLLPMNLGDKLGCVDN